MNMEGGLRRNNIMVMTVVMMIGMGMLSGAMGREAVLHRVGGGQRTWKPNVNFSNWTIHERFYVLFFSHQVFGFDRSLYNVLEVNKTAYEKCIDTNFIKNITRGGRDVFPLTEIKPYYFLSSGGYCFHGMKLVVDVKDTPPARSPSLAKSGSSSIGGSIIVYIVLASALIDMANKLVSFI
ncbi:hypothetical protein L1049_014396 [Liquidambar formosana]|uniref:Phytocyanin domain-containing protein n=1 Tax=Liquidambar formosana TaxID=63359 RepID=A0AAP0RMR7_LIQFO